MRDGQNPWWMVTGPPSAEAETEAALGSLGRAVTYTGAELWGRSHGALEETWSLPTVALPSAAPPSGFRAHLNSYGRYARDLSILKWHLSPNMTHLLKCFVRLTSSE